MTAPLNGSESPVAACPFCGGTNAKASYLVARIAVRCPCGASGEGIWTNGPNPSREDYAQFEAQAIAAWNRRASPVPGSEEVDHLELALCRAYERGAHWSMENAGDLEYLPKAARDHADKAIASTPILTADKAEIARLRAELSELTRMNNALEAVMIVQAEKLTLSRTLARAESAERDKAALMEALKPFAEVAGDLEDKDKDTFDLWEHPAAINITVGDLRRARAILAEQKERAV